VESDKARGIEDYLAGIDERVAEIARRRERPRCPVCGQELPRKEEEERERQEGCG
jgi:DNA repair exonuclease SbcCD ATPase subunit